MRRGLRVAICGATLQLATRAGHTQSTDAPAPGSSDLRPEQSHRVQARSDTYLHVFQRGLVPGPNGAVVDTALEAPVYEYVSVRATQVDSPWARRSVDAEVSAWGALGWGDEPPRRLDGDVTTAFVEGRIGPAYLRLGRQSVSSPAARYVRFDGVSGGARVHTALELDAYAGWTVLPRWDARLGYQYLGSARDGLVRDADQVADADRSGASVAGARVRWNIAPGVVAGASFHDEREAGELARQNLGLDLRLALHSAWSVSGKSSLDTDSGRLSDARLWVDVFPSTTSSVAFEYLHAEPGLFLSRQSVLSVFDTSAFDEVGSAVSYRPVRYLTAAASIYAEVTPGELGMRSEVRLRATPDESERVRVQIAHTRMTGSDNGYHALRGSLGYTFLSGLLGSADVYWYLYDHSIESRKYSLVQAANLSWTKQPLNLLCGVSLVRSPYAETDLQSLLRVSYQVGSR